MLKCFGIISYLPEDQNLRAERIRRLENLMSILNTYFKLPIVIVAQNWNDYKLPEYSNTIYLYKFSRGLGIVKARYYLRLFLLKNHNFDRYIFLDDDSKLTCNQFGVDRYLKEVDNCKGFGKFNGIWFRWAVLTNEMLRKTNWDYLVKIGFEPSKGDGWEDWVFWNVFPKIYTNVTTQFTKDNNFNEKFLSSEKDQYTTWYKKGFSNLLNKSKNVATTWYNGLTGVGIKW